jgi:hypothetical protein
MLLRLPEWIHLDLVGRLFNALKDGNGEIHETAPWTMMLFNAWRLNAISASSEIVLSDRCVTRKKFLAARTYHGKPLVEFLKTLYDSMEMPEILHGGQSSAIDDAMSP